MIPFKQRTKIIDFFSTVQGKNDYLCPSSYLELVYEHKKPKNLVQARGFLITLFYIHYYFKKIIVEVLLPHYDNPIL